jgi:hypothetical protein
MGREGERVLGTEGQSNRFSQHLDSVCESQLDTKRLLDALADLHRLLEEYSPSWYTQELHEKAESALQSVRAS